MSVSGERIALAALLVGWALGATFYSFGGMIHFLLVAALIVFLVGRFGREG